MLSRALRYIRNVPGISRDGGQDVRSVCYIDIRFVSWEYGRENGLQDSENKRLIHVRGLLVPLFSGCESFLNTEIMGSLFPHLVRRIEATESSDSHPLGTNPKVDQLQS